MQRKAEEPNMGKCISCGSKNTELWRHEDGHFRKECGECGYVVGPFVSSYEDEQSDEQQTSWNNW